MLLGAEKLRHRIGVDRPAEEETLCLLAAKTAQEMLLAFVLDAFGDYREAKRMRHLDDGAHDGGVAALLQDAGDERAVDLQRGERKAREVSEARVARAEVIDRDANARSGKRAHGADGVTRILHQLALGDLELEKLGRHPCRVDDRTDARGEIELPELTRGKIHRNGQGARTARLPRAEVGAGLPQHPFADLHDEAAFFQDGNEFGGRNHAARRMLPAKQRLRAARPLAFQLELRLVNEPELLALERPAQLAAEHRASLGALVDLGRIEL